MSIIQHEITITVRASNGHILARQTNLMTLRKARRIARDIVGYLRRHVILSCEGQWLYRFEPREKLIRVHTNLERLPGITLWVHDEPIPFPSGYHLSKD